MSDQQPTPPPLGESVDVVIAGGGPVGLALACELGRRRVRTLVLEAKDELHVHPRATYISPRTMEHFRTCGLAERVRAAAVPPDFPMDVVFTDHLVGYEFFRFSYPTYREAQQATDELRERVPSVTWSRYTRTIIGQNALEPVLLEQARSYPDVTVRFGHTVTGFDEADDGVRVAVTGDGSGDEQTYKVAGRYLVGCDGGRSPVRKHLGITMTGAGDLGTSVNIFFRAPELVPVSGKKPGFLMWTFAEGASGSFIAINGSDLWVHSKHLMPDEVYADFDPVAAIQAAVGKPIEVEVLSWWPWTPRELIAEQFGRGRVMLAGDAAHLMSPTGGQGLNTGVGDTANLAWKLDAVLHGWAGPGLLDSYTIERRPVSQRNAQESTDNRAMLRETMLAARHALDGPDGDAARREVAEMLPRQEKDFDGNGLYFGADYLGSPIIIDDGAPHPSIDPLVYTPRPLPGTRLPHFWVDTDTGSHDLLGTGFTLLTTEDTAHAKHAVDAFASRHVPLTVAPLASRFRTTIERPTLLVRPDGHIAWRGNLDDLDVTVVDRVRGAVA